MTKRKRGKGRFLIDPCPGSPGGDGCHRWLGGDECLFCGDAGTKFVSGSRRRDEAFLAAIAHGRALAILNSRTPAGRLRRQRQQAERKRNPDWLARQRARRRQRMMDDGYRDWLLELTRSWRARRMLDPSYRERERQRSREKQALARQDPAYRERERQQQRDRRARKRQAKGKGEQ